MKVINITENKDGSANLELELDNKELVMLVEVGLTQVLLNSITAEELCKTNNN